jgi:hypothetical protein
MNNQSFITRLIMKTGLAKSEQQVPYVLLAIAALALVAMFVFWPGSGENTIPISSPNHPINQ